MKLYKFYKEDCSPCSTLAKIMNLITIPEAVEVIPLNMNLEEVKTLAKEKGITSVPVLMFENGNKMVGVKKRQSVEEFIVSNLGG